MSLNTDDLLLLLAVEEGDDDLALLLHFGADSEENSWKDVTFDFNSFSDSFCEGSFRFQKCDIRRLAKALKIPDPVILENGAQVSAIFGLCLLLRRFAYPVRLLDLQPMFGRSVTTLGRILQFMVKHIYEHFSSLLSTLQQPWLQPEKLKIYAEKVAAKGAPLQNCWGFIDGTVRPIARPKYDQKEMFNGHKRTHAIKFQAVMAPNGLMATVNGPFAGRRHDSGILNESGLLTVLEELMNDQDGNPYCIYGDPAYPLRTHLMCPFKGTGLSGEQTEFNKAMATVRTAVEWGFGKILRLFAFLDFKKNLKFYLQPVGQFYVVGTLLTNAHTCLYGSQMGDFFDLKPPSLEEYFGGLLHHSRN